MISVAYKLGSTITPTSEEDGLPHVGVSDVVVSDVVVSHHRILRYIMYKLRHVPLMF